MSSKYDPMVQQLIAGLKLKVTLDENFNTNGMKSHLYREIAKWEQACGRPLGKTLHQWLDEGLEASNLASGRTDVYMQLLPPNRSAIQVSVIDDEEG